MDKLEKYYDIELQDDCSKEIGGVSFAGEKVKHILTELRNYEFEIDTLQELNTHLKELGIKEIKGL